MILTDDNFATLVHAVEFGRGIYARITADIGYQLTQLFGLVSVFPSRPLSMSTLVWRCCRCRCCSPTSLAVIPVIIITLDEADPGLMQAPPRDPQAKIFNRTTRLRWGLLDALLGVLSLLPVALGPDTPSTDRATTSVTMGFAVMALATAFAGFVMRRTEAPALTGALVRPALLTAAGVVLTVAVTEIGFMQGWLRTTSLSGDQWLICLGLALAFPIAVEAEKAWRRRPRPAATTAPATAAL
jgi:P-type Ca2+ transporter type 2C